MASFTFSRGGGPLIKKSSVTGEGYFHTTLSEKKNTVITVLENPVDEPIRISFSVNNEARKEYVISPKRQLGIETDISYIENAMKVSLKGDRRTILLKTILGMKHSRR